jgi:predicted component of type VI protein secretion system
MDVVLEIVEGPGAGKQVTVTGPIEIGRGVEGGLVLDDDLASRHHARLVPGADGATVEDLNSSNGTFVNGHQVHSPTGVFPGDQLLIGATVIEVRSHAQITRRPSAVHLVPPALARPLREPDYVAGAPVTPAPAPSRLDPLLDVRAKAKARMAPLAVFVLVTLIVLIYLAALAPQR